MKKLITITGILVLTAVIAYPVFAWGPKWGGMHRGMGYRGHGPGYCWQGTPAYGALTPEQQTKLDKLQQDFYNETAKLRSELWAKRGELNALLSSPNPDEQRVKELQAQINELRNQLSQKRLDFDLQARKIVPNTPGPYGGPGYGMHRGPYGPGYCWN
ncbi:MAG: hypothetical protein DRG71_10420 [Deltaproteobacteria bacterium]|nr:MAG: hypothetical protein DRG71_10420 [Deltaproteobacteria bacterium]